MRRCSNVTGAPPAYKIFTTSNRSATNTELECTTIFHRPKACTVYTLATTCTLTDCTPEPLRSPALHIFKCIKYNIIIKFKYNYFDFVTKITTATAREREEWARNRMRMCAGASNGCISVWMSRPSGVCLYVFISNTSHFAIFIWSVAAQRYITMNHDLALLLYGSGFALFFLWLWLLPHNQAAYSYAIVAG